MAGAPILTSAYFLLHVPFRTLALLSPRLHPDDSDRNTDPNRRSLKPTFIQTKTVSWNLANGMHLSNRNARHAAAVCRLLADDLLALRGDICPRGGVRSVLVGFW